MCFSRIRELLRRMNFIDRLDKSYSEEKVDEWHNQGYASIEPVLKSFLATASPDSPALSIEARWAQVREVIEYTNAKLEYWENRRTQFLQIGSGLLVAAIAGVITIVNSTLGVPDPTGAVSAYDATLVDAKEVIYWPLLLFCLFTAIGCMRLIWLWGVQNNPHYPFSKGYRLWNWHYRHAEVAPQETAIHLLNNRTFEEEIAKFSQNLLHYKKRMLESSDEELLDQDMSMAYVLLINEKFKIKMVSQLRDCLLRSVLVSVWLSAPLFLILLAWKLYTYLAAS